MKNTLKCSLYILARVILVCLLSFMAIPFSSMASEIINPILAVFYTFMLIYFFVLTMWHEGGLDANRVSTGQMKEMKYKGFLSAFIVTVPLMAVNIAMTLVGSELRNWLVDALRIVKVVFAFCASYAITLFTSTTDADILEGAATKQGDAVTATVVFCVILIVASVSAGIGYIIGYKRIEIFRPIKEKILGKKN